MGGYSLQFCIEVASGDVHNVGSVMGYYNSVIWYNGASNTAYLYLLIDFW